LNNREAGRQAEKAFVEKHKGPGKFSGKCGPQPDNADGTGLEDALGLLARIQVRPDALGGMEAASEEFSEDWPSTVLHQIQGARITLSASYNQKDWEAKQDWISRMLYMA